MLMGEIMELKALGKITTYIENTEMAIYAVHLNKYCRITDLYRFVSGISWKLYYTYLFHYNSRNWTEISGAIKYKQILQLASCTLPNMAQNFMQFF